MMFLTLPTKRKMLKRKDEKRRKEKKTPIAVFIFVEPGRQQPVNSTGAYNAGVADEVCQRPGDKEEDYV